VEEIPPDRKSRFDKKIFKTVLLALGWQIQAIPMDLPIHQEQTETNS